MQNIVFLPKPSILILLRICARAIALNLLGLYAWVIIMNLAILSAMMLFAYSQAVIPASICSMIYGLTIYALLPLCAFASGSVSVSFLTKRQDAFAAHKAVSFVFGSIVVWMSSAAIIWSAHPRPHSGCVFGAGPELIFPFPFFEVFAMNTIGQGWAAYKLYKQHTMQLTDAAKSVPQTPS